MKLTRLMAPLLLVGLGFAGAASASLIGDTVTTQIILSTGEEFAERVSVVGAGDEGNFGGSQFFDYGADTFSLRSTNDFCGYVTCSTSPTVSLLLGSLDFGSAISGVTFASSLTGVSVVFGANFATFSWSNQVINTGTYLTAQFTRVPEPSTLVLWAIALAGLGFVPRKSVQAK